MTLLFVILLSRVYWVQVVKGDFWYDMAKTRWSTEEKLYAKRGTITDRDGTVLAMDTLAYNVSVNPKLINSLDLADEVAKGLHTLLGKPEAELYKLVTAQKEGTDEYFVYRSVGREGLKIDKELADKVKAFSDELAKKHEIKNKDVGIHLANDTKRYYPKNMSASQLLGYIDLQGEAKTGIEAFFDEKLRGEDGNIIYEKDGKRVELANGEISYQPAKDGQDITLTIDAEIQRYLEDALKGIVDQYHPKTVTAVAADPKTMEILAMAQMPTYNPNIYWKSDYENAYNHSIKSLYEPGSTFKIVTLAAAVEEGLFNPNASYKSGSINIPRSKPVNDINKVGWGTISYLDGLKHSSNVAFVKLGLEQLGGEKLVDYINRFGFGQKTGIALGGEASGKININLNRPSDIARASFGQGEVQVTAIQQVAAVAAVANGGKLLQPQIIKQIYDPSTKTTQKFEPKVIRQVISPESSKKVGEYLEQVVSDKVIGTGKNAYIEGYRVAGKTGTAQKVVNGVYSKTKFVVSFIGYAPVEDPKIVLYIVVDEPNNSLVGGGTVAAPAFKEVVSKTLRHYGIAPSVKLEDEPKKKDALTAPDMRSQTVVQAKALLKAKNLDYEIVGNGTTVLQQIPANGTVINSTQRIYLITEQRDKLKIPDMSGLSLRDALEVSSVLNIRLIVEGQGYVVSQQEELIKGERHLRLKLQPPEGAEAIVSGDSSTDNPDDAAGDTSNTGSSDGEGSDSASNEPAD
ncbi:penicillin-binding transpeptidase domain-containing protein [Paenibacillus radicis (ex Gao et al. 2016)]|uniref:Penicillin-binding protein 2B n=1 Tax=Paenibacillus radicis (ex Gao et al. 2016) TaxID=1737354 RepID=A0A917HSV1_9BACL|nr:penicillin-binding transpeptidase domain-containing protein [Paenibacillus radicis (ex Gao et al. 2016)]GGG88938.1 penicillin-binding protein 2B [Paenibacillus radicis (ex Gao et al. 2016)]